MVLTGEWVCSSEVAGPTTHGRPTRNVCVELNYARSCQYTLLLSSGGDDYCNKKIQFNCDNKSVVDALRDQSSTCPWIMAVIRAIILLCLHKNILFKPVHLPGKENIYADLLSCNSLQKFHEKCADEKPPVVTREFQVPPEVWSVFELT